MPGQDENQQACITHKFQMRIEIEPDGRGEAAMQSMQWPSRREVSLPGCCQRKCFSPLPPMCRHLFQFFGSSRRRVVLGLVPRVGNAISANGLKGDHHREGGKEGRERVGVARVGRNQIIGKREMAKRKEGRKEGTKEGSRVFCGEGRSMLEPLFGKGRVPGGGSR